jgi:hypothetical protein
VLVLIPSNEGRACFETRSLVISFSPQFDGHRPGFGVEKAMNEYLASLSPLLTVDTQVSGQD